MNKTHPDEQDLLFAAILAVPLFCVNRNYVVTAGYVLGVQRKFYFDNGIQVSVVKFNDGTRGSAGDFFELFIVSGPHECGAQLAVDDINYLQAYRGDACEIHHMLCKIESAQVGIIT